MKNGCAETKYQAGIEKFKDKLAVLFDISGCNCDAIVKCADVMIVIYNQVPKLSRYSCLLKKTMTMVDNSPKKDMQSGGKWQKKNLKYV